ncbi:MAG: hypothetical protein A4E60_01368 [Syntrophorhabdus sp. PtaB.Bin047]|nr:MAG: hypothetical protein A4E60_01368 [Syntrophorhabdus sp. PtaB.Bin047]
MEFVLGVGMESQLLNCLFSNLMGLGKQLFPQAQAGASNEGQTNAFFDILSQRMGGNLDLLLSSMPAGIAGDDGKAAGGEGSDTSLCPVAASLDPEDIPVLVSSLISAMGQPVVTASAPDMSKADREAVTEFLQGILEILSGGDEVELTSAEAVNSDAVEGGVKGDQEDARGAQDLMSCLASVLSQLPALAQDDGGTDTVASQQDGLPVERRPGQAEKVERPDPSLMKAEVQKAVPQAPLPEDNEDAGFVVEIVRAEKKAAVADPSMKKEMETQPAAPVAETPDAGKKDAAVLAARASEASEDTGEPEKIVIRVKETIEAQVGEDQDGGDNPVIQHNDVSRQGTHQATGETKGVAKNDFGSMMVDKIEKLTEHFSGRNMNMDMTVRLKIGDNETVLVGLKDEGSSVTVEVRGASESTMNFLQSQKDDIARTLESKNIQTTIHVDIDQDAEGKRQQKQHRNTGEEETAEQKDFGSFFETLA